MRIIQLFIRIKILIIMKSNLITLALIFFSLNNICCSEEKVNDIIELPSTKPDDDKTDSIDSEEPVDTMYKKISYIISPEAENKRISKLIYGVGYYGNEDKAFNSSATFVRFGGNNTTPYNWEINSSNAGKDWYHNSYIYDSSLGEKTAGIWHKVIDGAQKTGKVPFIALPMIYNVVADHNGEVKEEEGQSRWKKVIARKPGGKLSLEPDKTDDYVYFDEAVNYLTHHYGKGNIKYCLDNEPEIWSETHELLMKASGHPGKITCSEYWNRTVEFANALKDVDELAEIFGFVSLGFLGYLHFAEAPDWRSDINKDNKYDWFIDYYLEQNINEMRKNNRRLIDVLDLHWYPIEVGDNPINKRDVVSTVKDMQVRLQAPRGLWDKEYYYEHWTYQYYRSYFPIIPRLIDSFNEYDPDMKLAFTEFQFGGYDDITGTIALSDVHGIYGKYGVYAANHWGTPGYNGFLAYDLYRNYDGKNSTFGDTHVKAELYDERNDKFDTSIYASTCSDNPDELHLIVLNKSMEDNIKGEFTINTSSKTYTNGEVYFVESVSEEEKEQNWREVIKKDNVKIEVKNNKFTYTLPKLSVAHIIIK